MKFLAIITLVVALVLAVSACTAPPEDLPRAEINEQEEQNTQQNNDEDHDDEDTKTVHSHEIEGQTESGQDTQEEVVQEVDELGQHIGDDESLSIWQEESSFEFEGYGPGKSHTGTFRDWEGTMYFNGGEIQGIEGSVYMNSVDTGIGGLDDHLLKMIFFDVEMYPEATFVSTEIRQGADGLEMVGDLTFRDVTQEIVFPVTRGSDTISTEFILDTTPFAMTNTAVNNEVRIAFTFKAQR